VQQKALRVANPEYFRLKQDYWEGETLEQYIDKYKGVNASLLSRPKTAVKSPPSVHAIPSSIYKEHLVFCFLDPQFISQEPALPFKKQDFKCAVCI